MQMGFSPFSIGIADLLHSKIEDIIKTQRGHALPPKKSKRKCTYSLVYGSTAQAASLALCPVFTGHQTASISLIQVSSKHTTVKTTPCSSPKGQMREYISYILPTVPLLKSSNFACFVLFQCVLGCIIFGRV